MVGSHSFFVNGSQYLVRIGAWTSKHLLRQTRYLELGGSAHLVSK